MTEFVEGEDEIAVEDLAMIIRQAMTNVFGTDSLAYDKEKVNTWC